MRPNWGFRPRAKVLAVVSEPSTAATVWEVQERVTSRALTRAGVLASQLDHVEIDERFAAAPAVWMRRFLVHGGDLVNPPRGGAIALGTPRSRLRASARRDAPARPADGRGECSAWSLHTNSTAPSAQSLLSGLCRAAGSRQSQMILSRRGGVAAVMSQFGGGVDGSGEAVIRLDPVPGQPGELATQL